jgi:hypothetical protein
MPEKRKSRKRSDFIPEELLVTCASGGPGYKKTEEHLGILAGQRSSKCNWVKECEDFFSSDLKQ